MGLQESLFEDNNTFDHSSKALRDNHKQIHNSQ